MASAFEQVVGPAEGACFGDATSTTAVRIELPDKWKGSYVRVYALTADLYYVFGDSGVDVVQASDNTITSEVITFSDTIGAPIPAGAFEDIWVPEVFQNTAGQTVTVTHMAYEAVGTGRISIRKSSV
jgi:hypothetical protein